jgi:hypothetical protein
VTKSSNGILDDHPLLVYCAYLQADISYLRCLFVAGWLADWLVYFKVLTQLLNFAATVSLPVMFFKSGLSVVAI